MLLWFDGIEYGLYLWLICLNLQPTWNFCMDIKGYLAFRTLSDCSILHEPIYQPKPPWLFFHKKPFQVKVARNFSQVSTLWHNLLSRQAPTLIVYLPSYQISNIFCCCHSLSFLPFTSFGFHVIKKVTNLLIQ